jgi:hypothetical protein
LADAPSEATSDITRIDTNEIPKAGQGLTKEQPSFTSGDFSFFILKFAFIRVIRGRSTARWG